MVVATCCWCSPTVARPKSALPMPRRLRSRSTRASSPLSWRPCRRQHRHSRCGRKQRCRRSPAVQRRINPPRNPRRQLRLPRLPRHRQQGPPPGLLRRAPLRPRLPTPTPGSLSMVSHVSGRNGWVVWLTFAIGLLLSVSPLPQFMEIFRPLWLALLLTFWVLALPHKYGMTTAWILGLMEDVLYGTLLGQNALILSLITFLVMSLQQRLRMFPMWQQCLVLLVVFGLAQLAQLWLSALTGNRQPTLALVLPALVSALLWPWVSYGLRGLRKRLKIN
ncbi:Rod shape-determining protein MreD [Pseudomonas syringae pv. delphinii]|nr:Rod shape-determining protein MreD [Pseudomonas syringae pv. delphinii]